MHDPMQLFRQTMDKNLPRIAKATYSTASIESSGDGFVIVFRWKALRNIQAGECRVVMSRERVLGAAGTALPHRQRQLKKSCRMIDEVISEVLRARGI